jgi:hypothetical protein
VLRVSRNELQRIDVLVNVKLREPVNTGPAAVRAAMDEIELQHRNEFRPELRMADGGVRGVGIAI